MLTGCFLPELEAQPTAEEICDTCVASACRSESSACDEGCQAQLTCVRACDPADAACPDGCAPGDTALAAAQCIADNCADDCS
jgi:hypothetical protein